ncbi:MAG TPA: TonB-dependent receptor, partial [Mucilaginibacter sp.]|nr:TonB-dependent receptor [Mucilaginibacter sp.]
MKKLTPILLVLFTLTFTASAQRAFKSKARVSGLYTTTLDVTLDSLAHQFHLRIIFDRNYISRFDVVAHYFDEPLKNVIDKLCTDNDLHYYIDADQTIYIIKEPQDVAALKKAQKTKPDTVPVIRPVTGASPHAIVSQPVEKPIPVVKPKPQSVNFTVSGQVVDQGTGESLPASVITVRNTNIMATANLDGYFTILNVPADTCHLDVTYMGYRGDTFQLTHANIKDKIVIGLFASNKALDEVIINDKRTESLMSSDKRRVSVLQISPQKLEELPNIGEKDILRSFQLMPGVSASNESSSGVYVRGGTPDQNLVLFDGFTVYQVDHLYGFFSAFNSNAVKDVTLYKGGFSAKYGGRLSSVTDMVGKEGNRKEDEFGLDLSLLSTNAYAEMPIGDKSTLLLAYRRSYQGPLYDKIFKKFNSPQVSGDAGAGGGFGGPPRGGNGGGGGFRNGGFGGINVPTSYFYDLNAKYTFAPDKKDIFSWSYYQGDDNLDNSRSFSFPTFFAGGGGLNTTDKTTYGNLGSSLKWSRQWNPKLYSNTLVSYSSYHSDRNNSTQLTTTDTMYVQHTTNNGMFESNHVKDASFKSDWEWQAQNSLKLLFGVYATRQDVGYTFSPNDTTLLINQQRTALTGGAYVELEANPNDKLQIKPGLRTTYYNQTGKPYFEPRLSATYTVTDQFTLKASTGRFNQFTDKVIREDVLSGSRDF